MDSFLLSWPQAPHPLRAVGGNRLDRRPLFQITDPLGDHTLASLQPAGDDPIGANRAIGGHLAADRLVISPRKIDERRPVEIALERGLRHQYGPRVDRLIEQRSHEHAGQEHPLGIGKARTQRDGAGRFADRDVRKLDRAGKAIGAAVLEPQPHRRAASVHAATGERLAQRGEFGARLLHVDIDRVGLLDHREWARLTRADERAGGGKAAADTPADRRGDRCVAQGDAGGFERGAILRDGGTRDPRLGQGIGIILLRDRLHLGQRGKAADAFVGSLRTGAGAGEIGGRLIDRSLIQAGIDLVEWLTGAHETTLGKQAAADQAVDLRPHFAGLERDSASAERRRDGHRLDLGDDKTDFRRTATIFAGVILARTGAERQGRGTQCSGQQQ